MLYDTQCLPFLSFCSACGGEIYGADPIVFFEGRALHKDCFSAVLQRRMPWEAAVSYGSCDHCGQPIVPGDEICRLDAMSIHADCLHHWGQVQFPSQWASSALLRRPDCQTRCF